MGLTMIKFGLKIWSNNTEYINKAHELHRKGIFDYVELYVVPGSKANCLDCWPKNDFPYILHAPHSYSGLNLSVRNCESENRVLIEEVESFSHALKPSKIIFHPGINGSVDETIRQVIIFKGDFQELFKLALIENKPRIGLNEEICVGSSPEEIERIVIETGMGVCLDIGHAIYYAAWANLHYKTVIDKFLGLRPDVFHIADGDVKSKKDSHLNFGNGNFDLRWIIKKIPMNACVSIETEKDFSLGLSDFEKDIRFFSEIYGNRDGSFKYNNQKRKL
jgi:deoxyribonuclease-4